MRFSTLIILVLCSALGAQESAPSTDFYKAKVFSAKATDPVAMNGYYVNMKGWPELMKVSDRHTMWGHAQMPPGSFGQIIPGLADLPAGAKAEKRDGFTRTVQYALPEGGNCSFIFNDLSPAIWMEGDSTSFTAFATKAGSPKAIAYASKEGIGYVKEKGATLAGADMAESWILVWRGPDPAYQNHFIPTFLHTSPNPLDQADFNKYVKQQPADAPWLVVFQHKPSKITLLADGILAEFSSPAGTTAFLPIGGFRWYRGIDTAEWANQLPPAVAQHCRDWNKFLKFIPKSVKEEYAVAPDAVRIKTTFEFTPVADDWNTQGVRFSPLSSPTALALLTGLKNLSTEPSALVDMDYPTLTGALAGFANTDNYTLTFRNWEPYATIPAPAGTKTPNARIQAKLETHLKEMIAAGHLAPYDATQGTLIYSFFGSPADLASTLIAARRHVGAELQQQIDAYLKADMAKYPLLKYSWTPADDGARREAHPVDLTMKDVLGRRRKTEAARIENLYSLWEYSQQYDDWAWMSQPDQWDAVKQFVASQGEKLDWEMGFHNGGVADLNARIKGLLGYRQLALQKKDAAATNEATALLVQAYINRFAFAKLGEYRFTSNQFYVPKEFDLPRFHARNSHKFNIFLPAYKIGADYRIAEQVGLVSNTDRYLAAIGNFFHDHSVWTFTNLTPPLSKFLADTTIPELKNYLFCIDEGMPTWYVAKAENLNAVGEDAYFSPYVSWPIFQARAQIYHEPAAKLAGYIDLPYGKGDLFYLQNLVAALEAE